ncbi:Aminotransferase class V domain [Trinorchestia longiramus]|nr:Aminotransferase class V domain [Trinorchestia longiramus]
MKCKRFGTCCNPFSYRSASETDLSSESERKQKFSIGDESANNKKRDRTLKLNSVYISNGKSNCDTGNDSCSVNGSCSVNESCSESSFGEGTLNKSCTTVKSAGFSSLDTNRKSNPTFKSEQTTQFCSTFVGNDESRLLTKVLHQTKHPHAKPHPQAKPVPQAKPAPQANHRPQVKLLPQTKPVPQAKPRRWFVLLDAASLVATSPLDLSTTSPDFVPVSFYKMFGYPTGLGCLLLHRRAWRFLDKRYFGGGTVELADARSLKTVLRKLPADRFEDGTVSFLAIAALRHGFDCLAQLCGKS